MRWAARLYPAPWRARYGAEFEALLEDIPAGRRVFWNTLTEALKMRILSWDPRKIAILAGGSILAGTAVGVIVSFAMPVRYESRAYTRVNTGGEDLASTASALGRAARVTLSRGSLTALIMQYHLYPQLVRESIEDAVEEMQRHVLVTADIPSGKGIVFQVAFDYPDPAVAQTVTKRLSVGIDAALVNEGRWSGMPITVEPEADGSGPPWRVPNRIRVVRWLQPLPVSLAGGLAGLLLGFLAAAARRRPRMAMRAAVGCLAGGLLGWGSCVAYAHLLGGYTSSALVRLPGGEAQTLIASALDRASLAAVVSEQHLYPGKPSEQAVEELRRNIEIQQLGLIPGKPQPHVSTPVRIQFTGANKYQAREVVQVLGDAMIQANVRRLRALGRDDPEFTDSAMLTDPANVPMHPNSPSEFRFTAIGLLSGAVLGPLAMRRRRAAVA